MSNNLTGNKVSLTYGKLVQVVDGVYYDGLGNLLNIGGVSVKNGLSIANNDVILGGTLSQNTTINADEYNFTLGNAEIIQFTSSIFDVETEGIISLDGQSMQILADDTITLSSFDTIDVASNNLNFVFSTGSVTSINGEGLVYTSDYSGTFVTNSLVTKKYVDDSTIYNLYEVNSMTYSATLSEVKKDYFGVGWTSSSVTFNLPPLSGVINGKVITIKDETGLASINPITINTNGSDKIDGLNQVIIQTNYASLSIIKKSNGWWII